MPQMQILIALNERIAELESAWLGRRTLIVMGCVGGLVPLAQTEGGRDIG